MISPSIELDNGLVISYARVVSAGNIEFKLRNVTGTDISITPSVDWYVTIVE